MNLWYPEAGRESIRDMQRVLITIISVLALGLSTLELSAQIPNYDPTTGEINRNIGEPRDYRTDEEKAADEAAEKAAAEADTTEQEPPKPLLSYYFDDTTRYDNPYFMWRVSTLFNNATLAPIDTLPGDSFQIDYPFMRIDGGIGSAYLGNLGSATIPLSYFSREVSRNFSFMDAWSTYLKDPEQVQFYNTRKPFSRITYEMSGEVDIEENLFNALLSHNITPSTTVNINYNGDGTKGMYINQKTLVWNLALSAAHTGKNWAIHGGYIYNGGDIIENGGIIDDSFVLDTIIDQPNQIDVKLKDARNNYRGHTVWWTTSYGIPLRELGEDELTIEKAPAVFIGNSFNYTMFHKTYTAVGDTSFYPNWNIDPVNTYDSISQQMLDTKFFVQLQPYDRDGVIGLISAGVGNDFSSYYLNVPSQFREEWQVGGRVNTNSLYLYGDINGKVSKYVNWRADARLNMIGYRAGDLDIGGDLKFSLYDKEQRPISLTASARFKMTSPDYWDEHYFSNHFAWNNSFSKEASTRLAGRLDVDPINLHLGAEYELTTNKIYYDSLMTPAQFKDALSVLGIYAQKDFKLGAFNFNHRLLFQHSSNQAVAPVPSLSAYVSYFVGFPVVKNVLDLEIGVDGRYQTEHYGFGYNPALGKFYNQSEVKVGGFPYLDAFVSAKWKRMKILIKAQNFNVGLFGGRNYFMVAHYPQNRFMLKFRFSWWFYD